MVMKTIGFNMKQFPRLVQSFSSVIGEFVAYITRNMLFVFVN